MFRARAFIAGLVVAATAAAAAGLTPVPAGAASPGVGDGGVVANPVPAAFTPNILDGAVESMVQVGSLMVVGGSFTQVSPTTGAGAGGTVSRPYLFAFNASTGALDTAFTPSLNGEVDAIVPTADGTGVYVGGLFTKANGVSTRLAELSLSTGASVTAFSSSFDGPINALALTGGRLFVGGNFTSVRGVAHDGLASLNPTTGAVDPYLTVNLTGNHNFGRVANAAEARVGATDIAVAPDGSRLIVDGNFINAADPVNTTGYARDQIASIILGPTRATVDPNWNTNAFTKPCQSNAYDSYVRHVAWSPDGSYFVVAATGGYRSGSFEDCDAASRFNASSTGLTVAPAWVDYTGTDSIYSVAISTDAVYIGGHYRWLNNPYGQDNPQKGAVPRPGLAALNPVNGEPLSWNPGRNPRGHGAEEIYATSAGIWVGSDTDWVGNYAYKRQKLAFFPFAGGTPAAGNNTGDPRTVFVAGASGNSFTANAFNSTTGAGSVSATQPSGGGSINWSTVQGAFVLNGRIWFGQGGQFYYVSWDGANGFGTPQLVDPYDDPYWDDVINGSPPDGTTYQGTTVDFYAELPNVTGMFYANGSIYYTLAGNSHLFSRAFSPDTAPSAVQGQVTGGVISPQKVTVAPASGSVDFSNASGMFVANGYLWYATQSDGQLHKVAWNGSTYSGPSSVDASAGGNWAGNAVFVSPAAGPVQPGQPTAAFTPSCAAASCTFDGSASTAPGSTISSYAWDFGDGTTGTGVKPSHTYSAAGNYQVKLTVTNAAGATATLIRQVAATVAAVPAPLLNVIQSAPLLIVGQMERIVWGSRNVSSVAVTLNGAFRGNVRAEGESVFRLTTPGTYAFTFQATNGSGSVSKSITINVWTQQQYNSFLQFIAWWLSHTPAERAQLLAYFAYLAAHSH